MIPAENLTSPEAVDTERILDYLDSMKTKVSPDWHSNRRHEMYVIEKAMDTFGAEFEDFRTLYPDAVRRAIFTPDVIMTTQVTALEQALDLGYSHAYTCYTKSPRRITDILREVRDLAAGGLLRCELLWRFDPWTGTISACGSPMTYHCLVSATQTP